ncbi:hypothetical protein J8281_13805 [Aquimarina sp. U1-2]|uniref:hypothetical protein n=1 Tax=Aquimarina sp. U1-2 TaxID=2823141 RepID=UPI001AECE57D|nr:hypothetical protein [Aquimarina sp. U1-2]MBP2833264.1 hypothetical protein [Aquimarina sp. U1-2]
MDFYSIFKIDVIAFLLIVLYLLSAIFFYFFLLRRERLLTREVAVTTCIAFFLPLSFFVLNQIFHFKSIPPDTHAYAAVIFDFKNFNAFTFGVMGYSILNYIPIKLCFGRPAVFVIFNIFYFQVAILYLFKAFKMYCGYNGEKTRTSVFIFLQILSVVYPVALMHTSSILRESMMLMVFSICIYFLVKFYCMRYKNYVLMLVFILFLFIIRPITGICMVLAYFVAYVDKKKLLTAKNFLKFGVLALILAFIGQEVILSLYNIDFSIEWIAQYRARSNSRFGIEGYNSLDWTSPLYYLKNLFLIVTQYILSPLPILVSKEVAFNKLIPLLDSVFIIVFLFLPIVMFRRKNFNRWMILFLLFIVVPAIMETNISGAYRHRMNGIFMLLPLAAYVFSLFKIKNIGR